MSAAERTHSPTPEEVMAYLDGEPTVMPRALLEAHLADCETCQAIAADLGGVSEHAQAWTVAQSPSSLHSPAAPRRHRAIFQMPAWRPSRIAMAGLGVAAAGLIVVSTGARQKTARSAAALQTSESAQSTRAPMAGKGSGGGAGRVARGVQEAPAPAQSRVTGSVAGNTPPIVDFQPALKAPDSNQSAVPPGPMVIRTARLQIVVKEFNGVRATVEGIVTQAGGFVDRLSVDANSATAHSLSGSLRVPADRMANVLARLRQIGQVVEDTQGSEEVTDQIVDLDARLASARATEQRLTELLRNRTGKLSDVLEVERELARVRLDIERLDAQKTNVSKRVAYATIEIQISEERKAGLESGPLSLATRIRIAAADGAAAAIESVVSVLLFVLSAGPSLLLWGIAAAAAWLALRRRISGSRLRSRASE
jgi:Domain of unknown function (DUF4349)/Putative zinc-finger